MGGVLGNVWAYSYYTNYLSLVAVVCKAIELKFDSTKLLMQSLLPNHQQSNLDFRKLLSELDQKKKVF